MYEILICDDNLIQLDRHHRLIYAPLEAFPGDQSFEILIIIIDTSSSSDLRARCVPQRTKVCLDKLCIEIDRFGAAHSSRAMTNS